jgi:hypothetical protein
MLTHKDPEVQAMLGLLESQRDHAMSAVAILTKENSDLKIRITILENVPEPTKQE